MANEDNVMDLLDSLDVKQGGSKQKPKKSNTKRKENSKKATGEDILGFLDELESKKAPDAKKAGVESATSKEAATPATNTAPELLAAHSVPEQDPSNVTDTVSKDTPTDASKDAATSTYTSGVDDAQYVNPVSTISGWWNRNKGGLWTKAQETIHSAAQDAVNQARQAEAMVDKSAFSLNALQTRLTTVLNTIVPPISEYEQLKIHLYHDMVAYPSVDDLLYQVFDYVMDQVEGGGEPQLVSERGERRAAAENESSPQRSLNCIKGTLKEAEAAAHERISEIKSRSGKNKAGATITAASQATSSQQQSTEDTTKEESERTSEVYIAIQPVMVQSGIMEEEALHFVVVLDDSDHKVELSTVSQPLPVEWAHWLDSNGHGFKEAAIDPRDWVFGWVEDALNLSFGVIAQRYVTTRMGLTHTTTPTTK